MKFECPKCGRKVGSYKRRKGELEGQLTLESHWVPRPRAKSEPEEAVTL